MTADYKNIAWVIGALSGIGLVLLFLLIQKLNGKTKNKFDERQIAARDGLLTIDSMQLFLGAAFLVIGAVELIHSLRNRGSDGEAE